MPYLMASPGIVYRNLIITGAQGQEDNPEGPAMDVRAWDIRTGKLVWTFHTIPHPGEPGADTWPKDYFLTAGSPANWGFGSVDAERGLIFLPIGQPASQYYGGHRAQQNLYSSSVVALDAGTGKVRWHFQLTHHDLWDYDNAATPALMDVVRDGRRIPAVVTVAKSGLMFFLERETGKPIYPVEERPVPKSDIPGEETWPTQPFPVKPPPLSRLSIRPDEIFTGEPAHEKFCRDLVEKIGGIHNLGPYTPYSSKEFRIVFPGQQGGPNFGGVAIDPATGYVFVNSRDVGGMGRMDKTPDGDQVAYRRFSPLGRGTVNARFWNPATSLPCQTPPWAHLIAVNANTGDIAWKVPLGTSEELEAKGIKNTGAFGQGGPDRHRRRARVHRRDDRQALSSLRLPHRPGALGRHARIRGPHDADDLHGAERQAVRRRRDDGRQCVCARVRLREREDAHRDGDDQQGADHRFGRVGKCPVVELESFEHKTPTAAG